MINPVVALLLVCGLTVPAVAQSAVVFRNDVIFATEADRLVRDPQGSPLVGTNWVAQLYYGTAGAPESSLVPVADAPAPFRVPTTPLPGTWQGGSRVLPGVGDNQYATLQVRVWDLVRYPTWEAALGAAGVNRVLGQSAPFTQDVGSCGPGPVCGTMEAFRGFQLVVIPEPGSVRLLLLGLAAVPVLRRRTRWSALGFEGSWRQPRGRFTAKDTKIANGRSTSPFARFVSFVVRARVGFSALGSGVAGVFR